MEKKGKWSAIALWVLLAFSALYSLPTLVGGADKLPEWYTGFFRADLSYGLDLQGGLELRYTVDWKKAIEDSGRKLGDTVRSNIVDDMAKAANQNASDLAVEDWNAYGDKVSVAVIDYTTIRITFADEATKALMPESRLAEIDTRFEVVSADDGAFDLILREEEGAIIREQVVKETQSIIRERVEAFGLVDPDVRIAGEADIAVQIPGVGKEQMDTVRKRIGQTAQLTLRMVDRTATFFGGQGAAVTAYNDANIGAGLALVTESAVGPFVRAKRKSDLVRFVRTVTVPDDRVVGYERVTVMDGNITTEEFWRTHYLNSRVELSGAELTRAQVGYNEKNQPVVSLQLNAEGGRIFSDLTGRNVNEYMAIMLDETVNSAPIINEKISGGRASITMGGGSPQQMLLDSRSLVTVLNHGAYKAPVYKVHDHEVGPSLGADSVAAGKLSMALGMLLVIIFMLVYYRKSGVIAVAALLFNLLLILVLLVSFNSALTLPGLAGIILTVGMAVDANIIIFERIREELLAGKSPRAAVDVGYQKAWSTILDANVTTALAGFILLNYTSGPIRGFAVTLLMGIACSVFTAVYVSRRLFNWWLANKRPTELSI